MVLSNELMNAQNNPSKIHFLVGAHKSLPKNGHLFFSSGALEFISLYSLFNAIENGCSPNCFVNKFRLNRQIYVYLDTTYLIFYLKFIVKIVLKYIKIKQF